MAEDYTHTYYLFLSQFKVFFIFPWWTILPKQVKIISPKGYS